MPTEKFFPKSAWLSAVQDAKKSGGSVLTSLLMTKAANKNQDLKHLAAALGISYGYLIQVKNGERKYNGLSNDVLDRMAAYLELPLLVVYCAADKIPPYVLIGSDYSSFWADVSSGYEAFKGDPDYAHFFTEELKGISNSSKVPLVLAYERATGKTLIRRNDATPEVLEFCAALVNEERDQHLALQEDRLEEGTN